MSQLISTNQLEALKQRFREQQFTNRKDVTHFMKVSSKHILL